jgi:hypothetical protein
VNLIVMDYCFKVYSVLEVTYRFIHGRGCTSEVRFHAVAGIFLITSLSDRPWCSKNLLFNGGVVYFQIPFYDLHMKVVRNGIKIFS